MAGISEVSHSAFQRVGIIVIENTDELFPATETLSSLPPVTNNGVAILADGGGHATIAADLLTDLGVEIPTLGHETQQQLMKVLPETASVPNPIDLAGGSDADPSVFAKCARIILEDTRVGGILVVGLFGGYGIRFAKDLARIEEKASHSFGKLMKEYRKPIIFHSLFNPMKPKALDILRDYDIPVYDSLDVASKCMAVLAQYGRYLKSPSIKSNFVMNWGACAREKGVQIIKKAKNEGRSSLLEPEAKNLLDLHGAAVSHDCLAKTPEEAILFAKRSGGKMVLKIVSPDILHKSDANGVRLGLETDDQIRKAFNDIVKNAREFNPKADIRGVLVSPMAQAGVEVIIGTTIDDQFGPVIMYGLGGIMVEVIKDVAFRVLPISETEADQMIQDTRSHLILKGIRGNPPSDIDALKQLLVTCSDIIEAYPEIKEMDLNPVIVHSDGLMVVDARIILKP
jgi:acetyltransferase